MAESANQGGCDVVHLMDWRIAREMDHLDELVTENPILDPGQEAEIRSCRVLLATMPELYFHAQANEVDSPEEVYADPAQPADAQIFKFPTREVIGEQ